MTFFLGGGGVGLRYKHVHIYTSWMGFIGGWRYWTEKFCHVSVTSNPSCTISPCLCPAGDSCSGLFYASSLPVLSVRSFSDFTLFLYYGN